MVEDGHGPEPEPLRPWDVGASQTGAEPAAALPDAVREAARRAFDAAPCEALVADLVFDSLLDGERRAAVPVGRRSLRFGDRDAGADVTVSDLDDLVGVRLQVLPPERAEVEVRSKAPTFVVCTDDAGTARFDVPPGLFSVVVRPLRPARARPLQTAWVRL